MKRLALFIITTIGAGLAVAPAIGAPDSASVHWSCSSPILGDYTPKHNDPDPGEAVTYAYAGARDLHRNYAVAATFEVSNVVHRGWDEHGLRLGPLHENNGFVQFAISQWERFDYRPHLALAWALPHSTVISRDLGIMLDPGRPHTLEMRVHGTILSLIADGREQCSTDVRPFVGANDPKYFQVRSETSAVGTNGNARAGDIQLKRDGDSSLRPYASNCILHRHGIFWQYEGGGWFAARGMFYPDEPTYFTGRRSNSRCTI